MDAASVKASYADALKEIVILRRYTGAGTNRPHFDVQARGKAERYAAKDLIGAISQGDSLVIVFVEDLVAAGYILPVTNTANDKCVLAGRECAIIAIQGERKVGAEIVAYEIQVRG